MRLLKPLSLRSGERRHPPCTLQPCEISVYLVRGGYAQLVQNNNKYVIVIGNFNAKVGRKSNKDEFVLGDHSTGDRNAGPFYPLGTVGNCLGAPPRSGALCFRKKNGQCFLNSDERKQDSSLVLKRVSDTRWCARADATKALANGYNSFQKALQYIAGDETQTSQAIHEAKCLLNDLEKNENAVMAVFWTAILDRINGVSISLQVKTIELRTAVDLLKSLLDFLI
ncbi:hypothetical protein EVAR_37269_1 [Eumeta japonica]|uniref:Uncharacterized protein n=1 Tax=Eumeta variegata TaxID=151549 RepID=A0A4C1WK81_EUMVA|nr:hypothetical protein EVAR_37269_1 [Eumeta japonica]